MLLQTDEVRESYVEQVLLRLAEPDSQAVWLLRQDRAVRESYVAEVIDGGEPRGANSLGLPACATASST